MPDHAHTSLAGSESQTQQDHDALTAYVRRFPSLLTAFSGGVDSTLVAVVARQALGKAHAPAAIGDSASLPRHELELAREIAQQFDLELIEVATTEQQDPQYQANDGQRCFHCKTNLYATLHPLALARGIGHLANGTNTDDLGDYRPGLHAAEQAGVVSPLVAVGMNKQRTRALARELGLPNWDKPAAPCLASRLPYGTPVTLQRLSMVEHAEVVLRELGFSNCRVRHHETIARLEIPPGQWPRLQSTESREQLVSRIKALGYRHVTLDLEGFRTGSLNVLLQT